MGLLKGIERGANLDGLLEQYETVPNIQKEVLKTLNIQLGLRFAKLVGVVIRSEEALLQALHIMRVELYEKGKIDYLTEEDINLSRQWLAENAAHSYRVSKRK
jgi:hypothetical protein